MVFGFIAKVENRKIDEFLSRKIWPARVDDFITERLALKVSSILNEVIRAVHKLFSFMQSVHLLV